MKRYYLMQQDFVVAVLLIDPESGKVEKVEQVVDEARLPLLAAFSLNKKDGLNEWMDSRVVPASRPGMKEEMIRSGAATPALYSLQSLGLNLSDSYWFRPEKEALAWGDVNLYDNPFAFESVKMRGASRSPDASSNGELPKKWIIRDGARWLLKSGSDPFFQQVQNECIASRLLAIFRYPHVPYQEVSYKGKLYSACQLFTSPESEYVPAYHILDAVKRRSSENDYGHFLRTVSALGIPYTERQLDTMLAFDYLIGNTDRHYGNFGFLRNPKTLEFTGMAPLFDHGNSLWYQTLGRNISMAGLEAKPFRATQVRQIQLVASCDIDFHDLTEEALADILQEGSRRNPDVDAERVAYITGAVSDNLRVLRRYADGCWSKGERVHTTRHH